MISILLVLAFLAPWQQAKETKKDGPPSVVIEASRERVRDAIVSHCADKGYHLESQDENRVTCQINNPDSLGPLFVVFQVVPSESKIKIMTNFATQDDGLFSNYASPQRRSYAMKGKWRTRFQSELETIKKQCEFHD